MIWYDFFMIAVCLSAVLGVSATLAIESKSRRIVGRSRLFWCKKCGNFYMNRQDMEFCECPNCSAKNSRLNF
jgi:Zn finger protein HypA/HybF involved in hydrogenase expression